MAHTGKEFGVVEVAPLLIERYQAHVAELKVRYYG